MLIVAKHLFRHDFFLLVFSSEECDHVTYVKWNSHQKKIGFACEIMP